MAQAKLTRYYSTRKISSLTNESFNRKRKTTEIDSKELLDTVRVNAKRKKTESGKSLSSCPKNNFKIQNDDMHASKSTISVNKSSGEDSNKTGFNREKMKECLARCNKLEDLKAQLSLLNKSLQNRKPPESKNVKDDNTDKKKPAYEKYHTLVASSSSPLPLPYKYQSLMEAFGGSDTVVSMLHNRSEICTFSKLKAAVQRMTNRNFDKSDLGKIKTVFPSAYIFRQEKNIPGEKSGYHLTIEANLNPDATSATQCKPIETFTLHQIGQRKQLFHKSLLDIVKSHHREYLASIDANVNVSDEKLTRWHPKFACDQVPDVEASSLPDPPLEKTFTSLQDLIQSNPTRLPARVGKAMENVATERQKENQSSVTSQSKASAQEGKAISKTPNLDAVLHLAKTASRSRDTRGIPLSLLEKIRAKEAKNLERQMQMSSEDEKKLAVVRRLPDTIHHIRNIFISEKKPALLFVDIVRRLSEMSNFLISKSDSEERIKMLLDLLPEWIKTVDVSKGRFVKIVPSMEIKDLVDKINVHLKQLQIA